MTISAQTGFQTGDTVLYNGQECRVKNSSSGSSFITIEIDGVEKIVNKKDIQTFGIFGFKNQEEIDKIVAENKEKIKGFKQDWNIAKNQKWDFIAQMSYFWDNLGLPSGCFGQLNGEQREQYSNLVEQKHGAMAQMRAASNGVHRTVHETLSALC